MRVAVNEAARPVVHGEVVLRYCQLKQQMPQKLRRDLAQVSHRCSSILPLLPTHHLSPLPVALSFHSCLHVRTSVVPRLGLPLCGLRSPIYGRSAAPLTNVHPTRPLAHPATDTMAAERADTADPMGPPPDASLGVSDEVAAADEAAEAAAAAAAAARDTSTLTPEQRAVFEGAYEEILGNGVTREMIVDWVAEQYMIDVDEDEALRECVALPFVGVRASRGTLLVAALTPRCSPPPRPPCARLDAGSWTAPLTRRSGG